MSKNSINVTVSTGKPTRINVSAPVNQQNVDVTRDTSAYNAELARQWAVAEGLVLSEDYSSKHYANVSKQKAQNSQTYAEAAQNTYNAFQLQSGEAINELQTTKTSSIEEITTAKDEAVNNINSTKTTILQDIEFVADGEKEEIKDLVDTGKDEIQELTNKIKDNAEDIINRVGISMFDTKLSDHLLEGEESLGWALQGTFVSKAIYPDFYAKCLEEKEAAIPAETTLSGTTITLYNNSNGHKFYDIADKAVVDTFYNATGLAWFYGIDTENERIFLPRNKYLTSYIADGAKLVSVYGNGKAIGLTANKDGGLASSNTDALYARVEALDLNVNTTLSGDSGIVSGNNNAVGLIKDPTKSGITGSVNLENSSNEQYVYICVGNTTVNEALVDVGQLSSDLQYKADKTEVDGQWVDIAQNIAGAFTLNATSSCTFSLSSFLPNDEYMYEAMICASGTTKATSGSAADIAVYSSVLSYQAIRIAQVITRTSSTAMWAGNIVIPIGLDRNINIRQSASQDCEVATFRIVGYRRIGTNL